MEQHGHHLNCAKASDGWQEQISQLISSSDFLTVPHMGQTQLQTRVQGPLVDGVHGGHSQNTDQRRDGRKQIWLAYHLS